MSESDHECDHLHISRKTSGEWMCDHCLDDFVPAEELRQTNASSSMALDIMAGTFGATIFDIVERVFEKYGVNGSPEFTEAQDAPWDCEIEGHEWTTTKENPVCTHCGTSQYLG